MKNILFIALGRHNVDCINDFQEKVQDIDTSKVRAIKFSSSFERQKVIDIIYYIEGHYVILDEDEYNLIMN